MVIRNRLFPYPVLCEDTDDYREGFFEIEPKIIKDSINEIVIGFDIELDNPGLKALINNGKAEYVIHIECSDTSYRTIVKTSSNVAKIHISKSKVNNKVYLLGMIVATKNIPMYSNVRLDSDYDDVEVNFSKGSILAYHNMQYLVVHKNYEEFTSNDNIFKLCKQNRESLEVHKPITFGYDEHNIKIYVDDDIYNMYIEMRDISAMKEIVKTSLVMPALLWTIERLKYTDLEEQENCQSYAWFMQIDSMYKAQGKTFLEDGVNSALSMMDIVQDILDKPVFHLFYSISEMLEESE